MIFTEKPTAIRRLLLITGFILIQALLTACSQLTSLSGGQDNPEEITSSPDNDQSTNKQVTEAIAASPIQPNPYLVNTPSVPGKAQRLFNEAVVDMQAEDWDAAETKLALLTEKYPELSGPWLNTGIVYIHKNNLEAAEQHFKNAIEANTNNFDAYNQLAILYRGRGKFKQAEALYKTALSHWPDHATSHCNLGILYNLYLQELMQAEHHYQECQRLNGRPEQEVRLWLADVRQHMRETDIISQNHVTGEKQ